MLKICIALNHSNILKLILDEGLVLTYIFLSLLHDLFEKTYDPFIWPLNWYTCPLFRNYMLVLKTCSSAYKNWMISSMFPDLEIWGQTIHSHLLPVLCTSFYLPILSTSNWYKYSSKPIFFWITHCFSHWFPLFLQITLVLILLKDGYHK
jgi:hypothetical protein